MNPAVADRVAELEAKFNDGLPFQPVFRMRAGHPSEITPSEITLEAPAHPD